MSVHTDTLRVRVARRCTETQDICSLELVPVAGTTLPAFTRVDAALYWTVNQTLQLQLNVENLGNTRYFASAHSNNNITPGAPRGYYLTASFKF